MDTTHRTAPATRRTTSTLAAAAGAVLGVLFFAELIRTAGASTVTDVTFGALFVILGAAIGYTASHLPAKYRAHVAATRTTVVTAAATTHLDDARAFTGPSTLTTTE